MLCAVIVVVVVIDSGADDRRADKLVAAKGQRRTDARIEGIRRCFFFVQGYSICNVCLLSIFK